MSSSERFNDEGWVVVVASEYFVESTANLTSSKPIEVAFKHINAFMKSVDLMDSIAEIQSDPRFPQVAKDALSVAIIAQYMGGITPLADIPMTYAQMWEYVNDLPEFIGDIPKDEFMDYLEETYPELFQRDPLDSSQFIKPGYLDDPTGPQHLHETPLIPASLPAPGSQGPYLGAPDAPSPIVFDLDGDGVELTTYNDTTTETFFDIDGDGFAQRTAWVGPDDGLLARDLDESGAIESVHELFGSPSVDGFALLAALDDNGDHVINQYDDVWSDLLIWKDTNGDAVSQSGELHTLASLNIVSIDLAGVTPSSSTINGNPISHTSTYTLSGGTTRAAADAWFVVPRQHLWPRFDVVI